MTHRLKTSADGGRNRGGDCFGDLLLRKLRLNGGRLRVHWLAFESVDPLLGSRSSEHRVRVARAHERGRGVTVEEVLELSREIQEHSFEHRGSASDVTLLALPGTHVLLALLEEVLRGSRIGELTCEREHLEDRLTAKKSSVGHRYLLERREELSAASA